MIKVDLVNFVTSECTVAVWKSSLPFVDNKRGKLIHRPKRISTIKVAHLDAHIGIDYWCGNSCNGNRNFKFLTEPLNDKLVCQLCDDRAIAAGQLSADQIVGRHVHKGRIKIIQTCCSKTTK